MERNHSQHLCFQVFLLVIMVSTPSIAQEFQASYNFSVNVVEKEGGILKQLLGQMMDLTELVHEQARENALLRRGLSKRFEKMDLKIEWALTDGTLAPKNVSGIWQILQENIDQLSQIKTKLSSLELDVNKTKHTVMYNSLTTQVSLVDGPDSLKGRLIITNLGVKLGTVCDDGFDDKAARVVCRMLGYSGDTVEHGNFYGPGDGPIVLDDVKCSGNENSLLDCGRRQWGSHNCGHSEDISIKCGE